MELYLPPIKITLNPLNGRYLKGHVPFNKGKKWNEWMPKKKRQKVLKAGMKNLRCNMDIGGHNAKKIVAIIDGKFAVFDSSCDAERKTGICARNIRSCCMKKRVHAGNAMWFFEDDDEWIKFINL